MKFSIRNGRKSKYLKYKKKSTFENMVQVYKTNLSNKTFLLDNT